MSTRNTDLGFARLNSTQAREAVEGLADVLIDCVEGGASVSFMLPIERETATNFWLGVAEKVERGDVALFVARDATGIQGTVHVQLAMTSNQPHRGEVMKLLVHRRARRRGIAEALMREMESHAASRGKTLLVLDTASDDAERLYGRLGWQFAGSIPNFALFPDGRPCATNIYWKAIG